MPNVSAQCLKSSCKSILRSVPLKALRQEFGKTVADIAAIIPCGQDFHFRRKLRENLTAAAAGHAVAAGIGSNGNAPEMPAAFADCFEYGDALSADRVAVRGILNVAAKKDAAVFAFQRGTDRKT